MIGTEKIFFDTAPFIYLVEDHIKYSIPVRNYITNQYLNFESSLFTSSITLAEFFVKPKKSGDKVIVDKFKDKLKEFNFVIFDITVGVAELSSELRAKYENLKAFDALQLATAINFGCTSFVTNDHRLNKITELKIVLVDNLKT
jgi:Predicted nucleic acid-binding protein, contains PIN domain